MKDEVPAVVGDGVFDWHVGRHSLCNPLNNRFSASFRNELLSTIMCEDRTSRRIPKYLTVGVCWRVETSHPEPSVLKEQR